MEHNVFRYYYLSLNDFEKNIYRRIYQGLEAYSDKILLPGCNEKMLDKIFSYVRYDNPCFYYVSDSYFWRGGVTLCFEPAYRFSYCDIISLKNRIESVCWPVIHKIKQLNPVLAVKYVHDWLVSNVTYDREASESQYLTGVFIHKRAVCAGIADCFKFFMDQIGVPCVCVIGQSKQDDTQEIEPHAWNAVRLNGVWYHVDATFDLTLSHQCGFLRYDYLNVSLNEICADHTIQYGKVGDHRSLAYYRYHGAVENLRDIVKKVTGAITAKENDCTLLLKPAVPMLDQKDVLEAVLSAISRYGYDSACVYQNLPQRIYAITWN